MERRRAEDRAAPDRERKTARRCVYCGAEAPLVWVHGHGQCSNCGINAEECCRGERKRRES